jgi:hypothetical protein
MYATCFGHILTIFRHYTLSKTKVDISSYKLPLLKGSLEKVPIMKQNHDLEFNRTAV